MEHWHAQKWFLFVSVEYIVNRGFDSSGFSIRVNLSLRVRAAKHVVGTPMSRRSFRLETGGPRESRVVTQSMLRHEQRGEAPLEPAQAAKIGIA